MKRDVLIGDEVEGFVLAKGSYIYYRTGQRHNCDRKCAAADHRYKHRIETPMYFEMTRKRPLIASPDKQIKIPAVGRSANNGKKS